MTNLPIVMMRRCYYCQLLVLLFFFIHVRNTEASQFRLKSIMDSDRNNRALKKKSYPKKDKGKSGSKQVTKSKKKDKYEDSNPFDMCLEVCPNLGSECIALPPCEDLHIIRKKSTLTMTEFEFWVASQGTGTILVSGNDAMTATVTVLLQESFLPEVPSLSTVTFYMQDSRVLMAEESGGTFCEFVYDNNGPAEAVCNDARRLDAVRLIDDPHLPQQRRLEDSCDGSICSYVCGDGSAGLCALLSIVGSRIPNLIAVVGGIACGVLHFGCVLYDCEEFQFCQDQCWRADDFVDCCSSDNKVILKHEAETHRCCDGIRREDPCQDCKPIGKHRRVCPSKTKCVEDGECCPEDLPGKVVETLVQCCLDGTNSISVSYWDRDRYICCDGTLTCTEQGVCSEQCQPTEAPSQAPSPAPGCCVTDTTGTTKCGGRVIEREGAYACCAADRNANYCACNNCYCAGGGMYYYPLGGGSCRGEQNIAPRPLRYCSFYGAPGWYWPETCILDGPECNGPYVIDCWEEV